ncbi:unnamed protein product [Effrenium voratum]|uniref:Sulfotransferase domain-containing protein n=1 Tax=Effrenium voratum TaxID=2562239 RepID=A0AA36IQF4_9DINO|nr:unnamed protein product [Effrenium voratum]
MEQVPTAAWWLLANLALCTFILSLLALPYFSSTLLFASLNGICVLVKTRGRLYRHTSLRLSLMTLRGYMTSQLQLILGAGLVFILPTLLLNIPFWLAIHIFLSATAPCWPALLLEPLTPRTMNALSVVMVSWWLLWKTAMLLEILINHSFYRSALAARRDSATPSFSYHLCDSVYAYSYSVLGFQLGWEAVHFCARFVYLVSPFSWSGMGILLMLGLRASIAPFGQGAKSVMHWSMHRMLHVQPFYACWHKEHHFAASQTCLTACQDCGLLETGPEAAYVQLCFVFIPFFDNCAYAWNSAYNTLIHHYYEEYRSWHWKLAGAMVRLQSKVRRVVSRMEWGTWLRSDFSPLSPFPPFWPLFALNLQFPSADYASAYFAEGPIEKHWHGRHHWTTEKHFGYGTYDSVSNLVWDSSSEEQMWGMCKRPAFVGFAGFALALHTGFFAWLWSCQLRAFPGYWGKYPTSAKLWLSLAAHCETLRRLWGLLTSPCRRLPDFYVVGCPKCGTSAIYHYLTLHPRIVKPAYKESRFIWGRIGLRLSALRYRSLFPTWLQCPPGYLTFDADPTAAVAPKFASALFRRLTPKAKIIVAYREPVEAAWSMYQFRSRIKGRFDFGWTFQQIHSLEMKLARSSCWAEMDALADTLDESDASSDVSVRITSDMAFHGVNSSMLRPHRLADVVTEFESRFGRSNLLLVPFTVPQRAIVSDMENTMRRIFDFVGLDAERVELPPLKVQPEDVMDMLVMSPAKNGCQACPEEAKRLLTAYYGEQKRKFTDLTGDTFGVPALAQSA